MFNELGLTISSFAGIYSLATILASLFLKYFGKLIDSYSIEKIVIINTSMMSIGCFIISIASSIPTLFLGFVIIRLYGQGLFLLTPSTSIAKHFKKNRGKALSIMTLGFSFSELCYPTIMILGLSHLGWRLTYLGFSVSNLLIVLPILFYLAKKSGFNKKSTFKDEVTTNENKTLTKDFTFSETINDSNCYFLIIASCIPPVLMTGLLFHQSTIFVLNSWPLSLIPIGYVFYAIFKIIGTLSVGPLIDKHGPVIFFIILILLLGFGTLIISLGGKEYIVLLYFSLVGFGLGMSGPVMNVIWPNMYGIEHLGEIKGFIAMFRNGLTALGPLPLALAIDNGINLSSLLFHTSIIVLMLSVLPYYVSKKAPRIKG
jgi:MFS family permease